MKSDRERLNWLEKFIRENSEIHLHDGGHPNGIGLGLMGRTLRQAIDAAMRQERAMTYKQDDLPVVCDWSREGEMPQPLVRKSDALARIEQLQAELSASEALHKVAVAERNLAWAELERKGVDAERYRNLRECDWYDSPLCVIRDPKRNALIGAECPTRDRLDELVDDLIRQRRKQGAGDGR